MKSKKHTAQEAHRKMMIPQTEMMPDSWIDADELIEGLKISRRTLHRWCLLGLVYSKIGSRRYFRNSEVHRFFQKHEQPPVKRKVG